MNQSDCLPLDFFTCQFLVCRQKIGVSKDPCNFVQYSNIILFHNPELRMIIMWMSAISVMFYFCFGRLDVCLVNSLWLDDFLHFVSNSIRYP